MGIHPLARRMGDIAPFHVMDLLAEAKALEASGRSIIHMEIGEPDFATPAPIIEAAIESLKRQRTHYTPAVGLPELREAISNFYLEQHGAVISPHRVVVTPGASGALNLVSGMLINPGDKVLMADPGYPCNRHFIRLYEGQSVSIPVDASTDYQLSPSLLREYWDKNTIAALIATPTNPTGTLIEQTSLQELVEFAHVCQGVVIVDEIYHGLVYGKPPLTAAELGDNVLVINSFSKYFGMTGFRLGWIVAPDGYVRQLDKLAQNIFLAAPTTSQYAALAAFHPGTREILDERREIFRKRRNYLLPALRELGFDIPAEPQGAFYIYANCEKHTNDSFDFCKRLLAEAGIAVTPGIDFGRHRPEAHVRFAYTASLEKLEKGVARLTSFLKGNST